MERTRFILPYDQFRIVVAQVVERGRRFGEHVGAGGERGTVAGVCDPGWARKTGLKEASYRVGSLVRERHDELLRAAREVSQDFMLDGCKVGEAVSDD